MRSGVQGGREGVGAPFREAHLSHVWFGAKSQDLPRWTPDAMGRARSRGGGCGTPAATPATALRPARSPPTPSAPFQPAGPQRLPPLPNTAAKTSKIHDSVPRKMLRSHILSPSLDSPLRELRLPPPRVPCPHVAARSGLPQPAAARGPARRRGGQAPLAPWARHAASGGYWWTGPLRLLHHADRRA